MKQLMIVPVTFKHRRNSEYQSGIGIYLINEGESLIYDNTICAVIPFASLKYKGESKGQIYSSYSARELYSLRIMDERISPRMIIPVHPDIEIDLSTLTQKPLPKEIKLTTEEERQEALQKWIEEHEK